MFPRLIYFLYVRKSTDVEDKQVLSIAAQIAELKEFAARMGIYIVDVIIEKQTAKKPGRKEFNKMLEKTGIFMTATEDAIAYITNKGYDPSFGARPLKRVLQQEVLNKLSKEILAGTVNDGDRITLDYFEETGLVFRPTE